LSYALGFADPTCLWGAWLLLLLLLLLLLHAADASKLLCLW
jgi:hypothetical protein